MNQRSLPPLLPILVAACAVLWLVLRVLANRGT